jgi:hypothetical protein
MGLDMNVLLEIEKESERHGSKFLELFTIPRNRRATLASFIVMFLYVAIFLDDETLTNRLNLGNNCKAFEFLESVNVLIFFL